MIHHGDCVAAMAAMDADSVDAIVTDPPYAFPGGFMGKSWDRIDGREDAGFAYWLAGLIDGEGHFAIKAHARGTHAPAFALKMRADEEGTLQLIRRTLGIGKVEREPREETNDLVRWVVQDKAGCQRLVDILDKYPLRAKKRLDYDIWREAVCEWSQRPRGNRWHGPTDNTRMAALRGRLMAVRKYVDVPWSGHHFQDWTRLWAQEAIRVMKPGAYILVMGGTKTYHRMVCGLEDAGFEVRDSIMWGSWLGGHVYASGFPKSKASLKPAWEPIVMARKPGPLRELRIDDCRIPGAEDGSRNRPPSRLGSETTYAQDEWTRTAVVTRQDTTGLGRWPANVILTDPIFDGGVPGVVGGGHQSGGGNPARRISDDGRGTYGAFAQGQDTGLEPVDTSGSYSRFFLLPKADRADREPVLGGSRARVDARMGLRHGGPGEPGKGSKEGYEYHPSPRVNTHATVKPTDLMRHLVRLVTPPGGLVLDPFLGSGTTALAAEMEGFRWIGVEREAEYVAIAEARLNGTQRGLGLDVPAPTEARATDRRTLEHNSERLGYRSELPGGPFKGSLWRPDGEDVA